MLTTSGKHWLCLQRNRQSSKCKKRGLKWTTPINDQPWIPAVPPPSSSGLTNTDRLPSRSSILSCSIIPEDQLIHSQGMRLVKEKDGTRQQKHIVCYLPAILFFWTATPMNEHRCLNIDSKRPQAKLKLSMHYLPHWLTFWGYSWNKAKRTLTRRQRTSTLTSILIWNCKDSEE